MTAPLLSAPPPSSPNPSPPKLAHSLLNPDFARTIPYWFIAAVGLIYASGFIVVTMFLETYGLRDLGTDLWKARYIHVGVLCSVFPIVPVISAYLLYKLVKTRHDDVPRPYFWLRVSNVVVQYLALEFSFYFFVMFSRRSYPSVHATGYAQLGYILIVSIIGPGLVVTIEQFLKTPAKDWSFPDWFQKQIGLWCRVVLILLNCYLFYEFCRQYRDLLLELLQTRFLPLSSFVLFVLEISILPKVLRRYSGMAASYSYPRLNILTTCISVPVYYLSLMAFSASVFSYIPAGRGGGDYTSAPLVVVKLKADFTADPSVESIIEAEDAAGPARSIVNQPGRAAKGAKVATDLLPALRKGLPRTRPCILIEETSGTVVLAEPRDGGGPVEWRKSQNRRPNVIAISRDMIAAMVYLSPASAVALQPKQ